MNERIQLEQKTFIEKVLDKKALIFIIIGISARILMFLYNIITDIIGFQQNWGDTALNFNKNLYYPPLTTIILTFFRLISFGMVQIFAFWAFLWDLITSLMIYYVLKNFKIKNLKYAFGLFLINPFYFLNNTFGLGKCGYQMTDAMFFFFFFLALIYYNKKELRSRYPFYIFLGLSMCIKYYTLPAIGFLFLFFLIKKNWKEMKIFLVSIIPLVLIFLIIPFFTLDWFSNQLLDWYSHEEAIPFYIRIIPSAIIALLFIIFRLRDSNPFEIIIVSIIGTAAFMFFGYKYIKWFQPLIFYGILTEKEFFSFELNLGIIKRKITVDNHLATFYLSFLGVFLSLLFIFFDIFSM
jgi:4-amino-4-deoxy-L-arabinose transferase-like glycosyltransferase